MSDLNYDQLSYFASSRAAHRIDQLVDIEKDERNAINIIFETNKRVEELESLLSKWSVNEVKTLFECDKSIKGVQNEKVSVLEFKEMYVRTVSKIKELLIASEQKIPNMWAILSQEDVKLADARKKENDEAISKFICGIIKVFAYSFSFLAGGTLLFVLFVIIAIAVIIARCHGS
jgi:hypothetical protein